MNIRFANSIPALAAGMLFFCTVSAQELPRSLFQEARWSACLRECQRIQWLEAENTSPDIRLLELSCRARLESDSPTNLIQKLNHLTDQNAGSETAALASFEAGRLLWATERPEAALDAFASAFQSTTNPTLFLLTGCSAFLVMDENPALKKERAELIQQINTSRTLWSGKLFKQCRPEKKKTGISFSPGHLFIHFYRTQISPAIGQRCTLEPSCSEYYLQATKKHNSLLAIPMVADRFIREPGVNQRKNEPILMNGVLRYRDPLDDHDFWMTP